MSSVCVVCRIGLAELYFTIKVFDVGMETNGGKSTRTRKRERESVDGFTMKIEFIAADNAYFLRPLRDQACKCEISRN